MPAQVMSSRVSMVSPVSVATSQRPVSSLKTALWIRVLKV